jgi:MFS family permease
MLSAQIVVSGILPLFWTPLANRYGRRPILMLSAVGSCACNIGGGFCMSFGSQMGTRILTAAMICPPLAIGSGAVAEMFFSHQRAAKMGWWTLLLTVGLPGGSFIMGFVVEHAGPDWPFCIFAIMNFLLFLGHFFLNAETLYRPSRDYSDTRGSIFEYKRIDKTPITVSDFLSPLACAKHLDIIIPTIAYSVVFNFAGAIIIEMPAVMYKLFAFNTDWPSVCPVDYWLVSWLFGRRDIVRHVHGGIFKARGPFRPIPSSVALVSRLHHCHDRVPRLGYSITKCNAGGVERHF